MASTCYISVLMTIPLHPGNLDGLATNPEDIGYRLYIVDEYNEDMMFFPAEWEVDDIKRLIHNATPIEERLRNYNDLIGGHMGQAGLDIWTEAIERGVVAIPSTSPQGGMAWSYQSLEFLRDSDPPEFLELPGQED